MPDSKKTTDCLVGPVFSLWWCELCVNDGFGSNEPQNVGPEVIETEIVQWPLQQ